MDEAETISRTLLLAQRTADTTVAEAQAEADRLLAQARDDAAARLAQAESEATTMVEAAKEDARRAGEGERVRVEGEVQALLARRDFLESDVDHLEQFLAAQRERITEAVSELGAIVQRVPNGLADMRRPLLSGRRRRRRRRRPGARASWPPSRASPRPRPTTRSRRPASTRPATSGRPGTASPIPPRTRARRCSEPTSEPEQRAGAHPARSR